MSPRRYASHPTRQSADPATSRAGKRAARARNVSSALGVAPQLFQVARAQIHRFGRLRVRSRRGHRREQAEGLGRCRPCPWRRRAGGAGPDRAADRACARRGRATRPARWPAPPRRTGRAAGRRRPPPSARAPRGPGPAPRTRSGPPRRRRPGARRPGGAVPHGRGAAGWRARECARRLARARRGDRSPPTRIRSSARGGSARDRWPPRRPGCRGPRRSCRADRAPREARGHPDSRRSGG